MSSLDCLMADMETFKNNKPSNNKNNSRRVEIEIDNKKEEMFEKKLDNLTDKLLNSLKTGSDNIDVVETTEDLGSETYPEPG